MNKRLVLIFLILMLSLSACSAAQPTNATGQRGGVEMEGGFPESAPPSPAEEPAFAMPEVPAADKGFSGGDGVTENSGGVQADVERIVIRNANLTIVVVDPGQSMTAITRTAETLGGFVVSSNLYKTTSSNGREFPEANITVRVPAAKLGEAMDAIKALVKDPQKDILTENVSGQDVTKEYTDLQSRLKNLEETESQLREIMGSATRTEDVLMVYNQLVQIREQIEVTRGQIQYYRESADMSAITVLLKAAEAVEPLDIGGWQPAGEARDAVQALINGLQVLGNIVIWLALFVLPIALLIFLPLRLLWVLLRRNRKSGKPQTPAAPPAQ
jgi:hypothetical protein